MLCTNCYDKKVYNPLIWGDDVEYKSDAVLFRDGTYYCESCYTREYLQDRINSNNKDEELGELKQLIKRVLNKEASEEELVKFASYKDKIILGGLEL